MNIDEFATGDRVDSDEWGDDKMDYLVAEGSPAKVAEILESCRQKDDISEIIIYLESGAPVSFGVLLAFVNLVTLSINKCPPTILDEVLKNAPTIKNVAINECPDLRDCSDMRYFAGRGEHLQIKSCSGIETLEGIESLVGLKRFSSLYGNRRLRDVSHLKSLSSINAISILDSECPIDVAFLKEMQSIRELALGRCNWLNDVTFMFSMSSLSNIYLQGSWNIPICQLATLRLRHPNCSVVFPWEMSKMRDLFSLALYLMTLWIKLFPKRSS